MKEAELIENAEYETLFRKDGRPKMEAHTTSGTFKAWKAKKPEVPIWADKTMVSLGRYRILHQNDSHFRENLKNTESHAQYNYKKQICKKVFICIGLVTMIVPRDFELVR